MNSSVTKQGPGGQDYRPRSAETPDRVAIYARVSTEDQAERETIENQLHACRQHADEQGWEVVGEFRDEGISGSVPLDERPAGHDLLTEAANGAFDRVLVYRLDRLSRDTLGCLLAINRLKSLKTPVDSVDERFDDSPSGQFARTVVMAVAELEKSLIRQRTMDGRARAVRNGKYLASTPPYGYVRQPDGSLAPDPEKADVVRRMFSLARQGIGLKAIARDLEEQGVPPPRPARWGWGHTTVHKILRSPRYIGQATYGDEPMKCPALIDEKTFDAVKDELKRRRQNSPRNTRYFYLLRGLVYCRRCEELDMGLRRYLAKTAWAHDKPRAIYLCRQRTIYGPKAGHENIKWRWDAADLDTAVKWQVIKALTDPKYFRQAQVFCKQASDSFSKRHAQERRLRGQLADLEQQEVRALEGWQKGLYRDEDQVKETLAVVRAQQQEVQGHLEALSDAPPVELTKAEKADLLNSWLVTKHAIPTEGRSPDEVLLDLFNGYRVQWTLVEGEDGVKEWAWVRDPSTQIDLDAFWSDLVTVLIDHVWVENDGTLTIEGPIPAATGNVEVPISTSPQ